VTELITATATTTTQLFASAAHYAACFYAVGWIYTAMQHHNDWVSLQHITIRQYLKTANYHHLLTLVDARYEQ